MAWLIVHASLYSHVFFCLFQTSKDVIEVACGSRYSIARTATCIFGWGRLCPEIDMGSTPRVVYKGPTQKIAAGPWHWSLIDGS